MRVLREKIIVPDLLLVISTNVLCTVRCAAGQLGDYPRSTTRSFESLALTSLSVLE